MRNHAKILCVVLALIIALSAAACSLTPQYSYKTDDVELPIGVYIYYLRSAYYEAQSLAQKSELYDSEAGTYDGKESFLKMEITDDNGVTAVAEDWIKTRALKYMDDAVAVYYEYNKLGATIDEATYTYQKTIYDQYKDSVEDALSPYGISYDSFFLASITIPLMKSAVFEAEYAVNGPMPVSDEELHTYFEANYTSYHYFSVNLYTTDTDEDGESITTPMTQAEVDAYTAAFDGYVADIAGGKSYSDTLAKYNEDYSASLTGTDVTEQIDADTTDKIETAVLALKEGEAKQLIIGDDENSRQIYLIYKDPIKDVTADYFAKDGSRDTVVSDMKSDDFDDLLKSIAAALTIDKSSAINDYKPSIFES